MGGLRTDRFSRYSVIWNVYRSILLRPHRLAWPRTPPFHGDNRGSNPLGDANIVLHLTPRCRKQTGAGFGPDGLLFAQRNDRIDAGCAMRRNPARSQSDRGENDSYGREYERVRRRDSKKHSSQGARQSEREAARPITRPEAVNFIPCPTTSRNRSKRSAPNALRIPSSRVLCTTE